VIRGLSPGPRDGDSGIEVPAARPAPIYSLSPAPRVQWATDGPSRMKILSPRGHGYIDYLTVLGFLAARRSSG
jgi:hypothetical protein